MAGQKVPPEPENELDQVLQEQIAQRAYEISQSQDSGTDEENWLRAEQEVRSAPTP